VITVVLTWSPPKDSPPKDEDEIKKDLGAIAPSQGLCPKFRTTPFGACPVLWGRDPESKEKRKKSDKEHQKVFRLDEEGLTPLIPMPLPFRDTMWNIDVSKPVDDVCKRTITLVSKKPFMVRVQGGVMKMGIAGFMFKGKDMLPVPRNSLKRNNATAFASSIENDADSPDKGGPAEKWQKY
jgi:hypothetical protein